MSKTSGPELSAKLNTVLASNSFGNSGVPLSCVHSKLWKLATLFDGISEEKKALLVLNRTEKDAEGAEAPSTTVGEESPSLQAVLGCGSW